MATDKSTPLGTSAQLGRAKLQWACRGRGGNDIGSMVVGDTEILFGGRGGHIQVHGHTVSRRHARILRADGGLWIEDLGGGAGVQVNGQPVERAELHNGDRIEVGDTLLTIWAE